jgi:nucleoside-diphosphate-sugar epimerase
MRIAITGGNGDMGRRLAPYLIEQGHSLVSIDRSLPNNHIPGIHFMAADTLDLGQLLECMQGCDALVHLAAIRGPGSHPPTLLYANNTLSSYNALSAAAMLGIKRVCLASSVNAIGGAFSRAPVYEYFPVNEEHPTYAEDPYSLSKWVMEQQADAFVRRYEWMKISSLRLHMLVDTRENAVSHSSAWGDVIMRHLWGYTLFSEANRAFLLSLTADFAGHEVFYIVAPQTAAAQPSLELAGQHFPKTVIRGAFQDHASFFNCEKAARLLGWQHKEN